MVNYNNGKIYKIIDNTNGNIYIGSTTKQYLSQRLAGHVSDYKNFINNKYHFVTSFTIIENNDYTIELIELYPCGSKDELHAREGYHIRNNECVNRIIVGRTPKEYFEDNKDTIREYTRAYCDNNKDKIREYMKAYCDNNKDKIRERKKTYYEDNKDKIREQKKSYCEANKEAIREQRKAYCEANKEAIRERKKAYREANKDKIKEYKKVYREKQKNKDLDITI